MKSYIHKTGFDRLTRMAWVRWIHFYDDSLPSSPSVPITYLLPEENPNVIMQVDYMETRPRLFKKTASGWVEYDFEFEKKGGEFGETFFYTSGETRLIGAYEELDHLHAALVSLLPHPLLVSIRRSGAMFLSHVFRIASKLISRMHSNREGVKSWKLVYEIVKNLGNGWEVKFARIYDGCAFNGCASGPGGMELSFTGRAKKIEPQYERAYPPPGCIRVNGRISFYDDNANLLENLDSSMMSAKISIEIPNSMTSDEMANEIVARLLPLYAGFLSVVEKHSSELERKT